MPIYINSEQAIKLGKQFISKNKPNSYEQGINCGIKLMCGIISDNKKVDSMTVKTKNRFNVGDKVFVKNPDKCYTTYSQWIECFTQQYQTQYSFGHKPKRSQEYTIVFIAPHLLFTNIKLCLIQGLFGDCYLVDMLALSKYNEEELEEIED